VSSPLIGLATTEDATRLSHPYLDNNGGLSEINLEPSLLVPALDDAQPPYDTSRTPISPHRHRPLATPSLVKRQFRSTLEHWLQYRARSSDSVIWRVNGDRGCSKGYSERPRPPSECCPYMVPRKGRCIDTPSLMGHIPHKEGALSPSNLTSTSCNHHVRCSAPPARACLPPRPEEA
jgi:hypothetical protein